MSRCSGMLGAGLIGLVATSALPAQAVDLQVRESASHLPVAGAIVRLIGEAGVLSQGLTNEQGRVLLKGPGPGRYRIKVDRIGWTGLLTDPFDLSQAELLKRDLVMASTAIELPALVVTGKSACNLSGAGIDTALLWEEIRKALTANSLTLRQERPPLHVREFTRELGLTGQVLREWVTGSSVVRGRSFESLPPATLTAVGFVQSAEDSTTYAAPDADLLLSDAFVGTHCFRAVPGPAGLVGLEFSPAPDRTVTDVRGTLWVDRGAGELKFLEYIYTGLVGELSGIGLGGRVEFRRLSTGAWIVSRWHTRMPHLGLAPRQPLLGFLERGGSAELAARSDGVLNRSIIMGEVFDSLAGHGLAGVSVRVQGHRDSIFTDAAGRFELAVPFSGDQLVVFSHPRLGLLRAARPRPVLLSIGDTTRVDAAVPSVATLVRVFCSSQRGRAGIVGILLRDDGRPAADLDVRVKWLTSGGSRDERDRTGPRGTFAICDLTPGPTLPVRVQDRFKVLLEQRIRLEPREYRWIELRLPPELN